MANEDAIRKGEAAKALMQNPDFIVGVDAVRLQAFMAIAASEPNERDKREENYYLLLATEKLKTNLAALVSNAQFEEAKLQRENETYKEKE